MPPLSQLRWQLLSREADEAEKATAPPLRGTSSRGEGYKAPIKGSCLQSRLRGGLTKTDITLIIPSKINIIKTY